MNDNTIQWYLDFIAGELGELKDGQFTGNITMQINIKDGNIGNLNCSLNKSIRKPEVYDAKGKIFSQTI